MSTTLANPRVYAPGVDVTAAASAAVTARRFVAITGNRTATGSLSAAHATAAGRIVGVAKEDATTGALFGVARGGVVKVTTSGAVAAFAEVEVGANGTAVTKASGVAVGYALTGAASGADAEIHLYQ
ncbi:capsid cement protein [Gordonia sp. NPDC003429]